MKTLNTEFEFAGFTFPRYVATLTTGTNNLRKKRETRKVCGAYYHAPKPDSNNGRGFYLNDAGQPFTRWRWCDDVVSSIRHTGWFIDDFGTGEKIRGIVVSLPHGRFLAGWSMGEGMASTVDSCVYDSAEDAAFAADSMAEYAADNEREYRAAHVEDLRQCRVSFHQFQNHQ